MHHHWQHVPFPWCYIRSECHRNTWPLICPRLLFFLIFLQIVSQSAFNTSKTNEKHTTQITFTGTGIFPWSNWNFHQLPQNFVLQGWDCQARKNLSVSAQWKFKKCAIIDSEHWTTVYTIECHRNVSQYTYEFSFILVIDFPHSLFAYFI